MGLNRRTCILVDCDFCDDGWDDYTPHFTDVDEAVKFAEQYGWRVVGHLVWCPSCAGRADCQRLGHKFVDDDGLVSDWRDMHTPGGVPFRTRHCWHCSLAEYDPPMAELIVLEEAAQAAARGLNPETPTEAP